jgi:hypothetical protein
MRRCLLLMALAIMPSTDQGYQGLLVEQTPDYWQGTIQDLSGCAHAFTLSLDNTESGGQATMDYHDNSTCHDKVYNAPLEKIDLSVSIKNQGGYAGEYLGEPDCFLNFAYGDWNIIQTGKQASDGSPLWQVTFTGTRAPSNAKACR